MVLVALGVIFIPALLDGSGYKSRHVRSIEIPAKPVILPVAPKAEDSQAEPVSQKVEKLREQAATKSSPTEDLKAWMVQVGTFENADNARKYRDELRAKGFTTHVIEDKAKGKASFKVRVGPEVERKRIESLKSRLEKKGVKGFIVQHG